MGISNIGSAIGRWKDRIDNVYDVGEKVFGPLGNLTVGAAKKGLGAADATGKAIAKNPKRSLGAAVIGGVGVHRAKGNINKQMTHVDPDQDYTVSAPISGVRYRSPEHRKFIEQRNQFY